MTPPPVVTPAGENKSTSSKTKRQRFWQVVNFAREQWIILGFAFACVMAYLFPCEFVDVVASARRLRPEDVANRGVIAVAAHGGPIRSEYTVIYGAVAVIFVISGLQLSPEKLKTHLTNWRLHALVQGICFLLFPAVMLSKYFSVVREAHRSRRDG